MAVQFSEILANAKQLADFPLNIDDAAGWLPFVNRSIESLWRLLVSIDPWAYFATGDFSLTASPSGASKDLSTVTGLTSPVFRTLHGVDWNPDTSSRRTVPRRNFQERNMTAIAWWEPAPLAVDRAYDLRGRNLVITPYENAAGTYRAYATVAPYKFTGISDVTPIDWQMEPYAEYLEIRSAMRALRVEESDTSNELASDLADVKAEIVESHSRDDGAGYNIADVEDF